MNDINKLGKITEIIGKLIFGLLVTLLIVFTFGMQLEKHQDKALSDKIAIIIGTILGVALLYFILRSFFRPIYNLNLNIQLREADKLNHDQFKSKWLTSLICSVIISLLPIIPTFGISIIAMIPQFILLYNSRRKLIKQDNHANINNPMNVLTKLLTYKKIFSFNLQKMTRQEQLVLTVIIGVIAGLLFGYITGEYQYYNPRGTRINLDNINNSSVKVFKFNYLLFFCSFIICSGVSYLFVSRMSQQKQ